MMSKEGQDRDFKAFSVFQISSDQIPTTTASTSSPGTGGSGVTGNLGGRTTAPSTTQSATQIPVGGTNISWVYAIVAIVVVGVIIAILLVVVILVVRRRDKPQPR